MTDKTPMHGVLQIQMRNSQTKLRRIGLANKQINDMFLVVQKASMHDKASHYLPDWHILRDIGQPALFPCKILWVSFWFLVVQKKRPVF